MSSKVSKPEPVIKQIGALQALCEYDPSSDSESDASSDDEPETLSLLQTSKSAAQGGCE